MHQIELTLQSREKNTKNMNRRLRRGGRLPGIVYGGERPPQPVAIDAEQFGKLEDSIRGATIFNLQIEGDGDAQQAIIREIQRDPVYDSRIIHIDFLRIQVDKPIVVEVSVHGLGTPEGVKMGGVLETVARRVEVKCLPLEVPEYLEIDISALDVGDSLHVSDLAAVQGLEILTSADQPLFIVAAATKEEEPDEGEAEVEGEGEEAATEEGAEGATEEKGEAKKGEAKKEG